MQNQRVMSRASHYRTSRAAARSAVLALATWGCSESTPPPSLPPVPVASLTIAPGARTFRALGDTLRLNATARDASGALISGKTVTWSTTNASVATVSAAGTVRAAALGSTVIKAVVDGVEAEMTAIVDTWSTITAGTSHPSAPSSCAIAATGAVYCWGGGDISAPAPLPPTPLPDAIRLRNLTGSRSWCGIAGDESAYCWGWNANGQLGDGSRFDRAAPVPVVGGHKFLTLATQLPVGIVGGHTCGLNLEGAAYCWGAADQGQLGIGSVTSTTPGIATCNVSTAAQYCATAPLAVSGGLRFRAISTGSQHSCGIAMDNTLYCWGQGAGSYTGGSDRNVPTHPPTLPLSFTGIASKFEHTCAWSASAAYCWGSNVFGQLGGGPTPERTGLAVKVAGGISFAAMSVASGVTCGLSVEGRAYCWGRNGEGQIGVGSTTQSDVPVPVMPAETFISVSTGGVHACGVLQSGAAYCWGSNLAGQLGNGTRISSALPVRVIDP